MATAVPFVPVVDSPFYVRMTPDEHTQGLLDSGWFEAHPGKSRKDASGDWWRNGALVVDAEGPGIVSAEGVRHSLPVPASGGQVIVAYLANLSPGFGSGHLAYRVFIADAQDRLVCHLPRAGMSEELAQSFAEAAGLRYVEDAKTFDLDELKRRYGDVMGDDTYSNLRWTRVDLEYRKTDRLRRLFGKKPPTP